METLIDKSINGDGNAYAELIKIVEPDLYKIARVRLKNEDDIEDAFQETIIKSFQNLDKLKHKQFFKTWIIRILINECNNINKSYNKNNDLFDKVVSKSGTSAFTNNTDKIDDSIFIEELLNKLDNEEKELAYLYFKENFTTEKIAKLLNSNKNTVKSKLYRISKKLKQLAILLLILCIITTTTVFAKDIIKFIISLFTTSRQAIDTAVENDYVQNVDMDFVYDNDIGIKVDYILIDNKNLDVSYVFDCRSDSDITSAKLADYSIVDENGNKIYSKDFYEITYFSNTGGKCLKLDNGTFKNSNLYTAQNYFPLSKKLLFHIKSIEIMKNNTLENINGNWIFEINLEDKFLNRNSQNYLVSYNEYITDISATIHETALNINISLNENIDNKTILAENNIILTNSNKEHFKIISYKFSNNTISLTFDIGKYNENINILELYIQFNKDKIIDVVLKK